MMTISKTILVASVCLTMCFTQNDIRIPPSITRGPPRNLIYRSGDSVTLDCGGKGVPDVTYEWRKNGFKVNQALQNIHKGADGTITIQPATLMDEGFYQCFAMNKYGTALSITAHVQMAFLESASGTSAVLSQYARDLTPFHIPCDRRRSFPKPTYIWEIGLANNQENPKPRTFLGTYWIQMAENGDLHFGHGLPVFDGDRDIIVYRCSTYNHFLNIRERGNYTQLFRVSRSRRQSPETNGYFSQSPTVAIIGGSVTLKCFFYMNWISNASWSGPGPGRTLPTGRYRLDNFNTSLTIDNITASDEGAYDCTVPSAEEGFRAVLRVRVEAEPMFPTVTDAPYDVNVTEGESFTFNCNAAAKPVAKIVWLQDGKQLDPNNPPERFSFSSDNRSLTIRDVCRDCVDRENKTDLMVIQCNASNVHGYVFSQGYLNVRYPEFNYAWIWISVGVAGFLIVLVVIFCAVFRSTRNKRAKQRNVQRQKENRRLPNLPRIYDDIGYDSIGFPLEELAGNTEGYESIDAPEGEALGRTRPTLDERIMRDDMGYLKPLDEITNNGNIDQHQIHGYESVTSESERFSKSKEQSESLNTYLDLSRDEVNPIVDQQGYSDLNPKEGNSYLDLVLKEVNPYLDLVSTEVNQYLDLVQDPKEVNQNMGLGRDPKEVNQYMALQGRKDANKYMDLGHKDVNQYTELGPK